MNGNNSRTIWRKRNKRRVKNPVGVRRQKAAGSRKTPTDGTKIGAEVGKPRLKNRSVLWTTGWWFENPEAVVLKPQSWNFERKKHRVGDYKNRVGGFETILKRASGDCVEELEKQAWIISHGRKYCVEGKTWGHCVQKGTRRSRAGTGNERRHAAELHNQQGNSLEASAEVWNRCQWRMGEIALTEKRSMVDLYSYRGASVYAGGMREPPYKKMCKKNRLKHGRDS